MDENQNRIDHLGESAEGTEGSGASPAEERTSGPLEPSQGAPMDGGTVQTAPAGSMTSTASEETVTPTASEGVAAPSTPIGGAAPAATAGASYNLNQTRAPYGMAGYQQSELQSGSPQQPQGYGAAQGNEYPAVSQQNGYQQNSYQQNGYQQNSYQQNSYQQNGYQQAPYYGQGGGIPPQNPPQQGGKGLAIASLVLGICSLVLFCTCLNIPLAVVSVILAIIYLVRKNVSGKGMAIAGIILSAISIVVCMVFWGVMVSEFGRAYMDIYENVYDDIMDDYYSREWNFDTDEWEDWQRDDRSGRDFNSYELPEQEENGMLPLSADLPLDELTIGKF